MYLFLQAETLADLVYTLSNILHVKCTIIEMYKQNTVWFKKMDSILYVYISLTIHGIWMIYITFERGGPKFSNTTARALT